MTRIVSSRASEHKSVRTNNCFFLHADSVRAGRRQDTQKHGGRELYGCANIHWYAVLQVTETPKKQHSMQSEIANKGRLARFELTESETRLDSAH